MTELIERYFDIAIKSPDGIKKLRELILSLAMQGRLVPQDPNDPPASELLKQIEAEKKKLIKEGKIKKQEPLPPIKPEEVPYALPEGWEWVRLNTIAEYNGRPNLSPAEISSEVWVLDLEDIEKDSSRILQRAQYSERESKSTKSVFYAGDVLYGKLRPYLNKVVVADQDGVCTTEIVPIVPYVGVFSKFLQFLLKRPDFLAYVNSKSYGVKMPRLGTADAIFSIHPLPPLAEQKRIVAKIDALMALCDKLEIERDARNEKRLAVQKAAVEQLLAASDEAGFDLTWEFIAQNFDDLYSVPENVAELKKTILQLAVMGKLVPQDPSDQPASELLKQIEAEKRRLVKEGKLKKQEPLPPIKPEEVLYVLPAGWEWVRLGVVGITQTGTTPATNHSENFGDFIPFIGPGDISNCEIDYRNKGLSELGLIKGRLIPKNSIMMVCIGGSIGKIAINEIDVTCNQQINTITTYPGIDHKFLFLTMQAPLFQKAVVDLAGGSATPIINKQKWSSIYIPIPPLVEQKRIVVKVDELMALCDELEQQLKDATSKQTDILNAVVKRR